MREHDATPTRAVKITPWLVMAWASLGLVLPAHARADMQTAALATAQPPATVQTLALNDCSLPGVAAPARCGTYAVYENRSTRQGRQIPLYVVQIPATGHSPQPDPVVFFAGGPGASSAQLATALAGFRSHDLEQRDFVFIDYRGSGKSKRLNCPYQQDTARSVEQALENFIPVARLPECLKVLTEQADLTQYTTPNIVDDVAEVVHAMGYRQVNLWGGSYGSRAVLSFIRRHPDLVRTAVIEGVSPFDTRAPVTFSHDAQVALDGWLRECREDAECQTAFPDLAQDLDTLLTRIAEQPQQVIVNNAKTKESVALTLSKNAVIQTLRYMLYVPNSALNLPAYIHAAALGNWQPIAQTAFDIGQNLLGSIPDGLYLSVTCTEDVARIGPNAAAIQRGFIGDFRLRQQQQACEHWITGELPAGFFEPLVSDKPVLIFSGEHDPVTPARFGYQVQEFLTNSRHMIIPHSGHAPFGLKNIQCLAELQSQFLETTSPQSLDINACAQQIQRPGFLLSLEPEALTEEVVEGS